MRICTGYAVLAIVVSLLAGCHSNPPVPQLAAPARVTGFTPFGVAGGYDVGSLIDYSGQNYKTLFTSEYIEQNARPAAGKMLYKLFHTPLKPVSPRYSDNQKQQFMRAIQRTLLTGRFQLSDAAKEAIYRIYKIDIEVESAVKKRAAAPEALQYRLIESLPPRGGVIIGIASRTGLVKRPVAVTSILAFNRARVTVYFDRTVGSERLEIFDKIHFDDRVTIRLGPRKRNSLIIEYTKPTIVAFKGYLFDVPALRFYRQNGRLPTQQESLALATARRKQAQPIKGVYKKKTSVNESDMYNVRWD